MFKSATIINIDYATYNFTDIEFDSISEVELTIDLGPLIMKNQINETFDDLLKKTPNYKDSLYILSRIRLMLHEGGILNLINTYTGIIDKSYLTRMEILINKAGFIDIEIKNISTAQIIKAVRRPVESRELGYGLRFKEVIYPDEIAICHQFAKDYYYYKDFNYDLNVVKQFDLNCDHYVVYDANNEICSLARVITRAPGYYCPFMYATIEESAEDKHFSIPGNDMRIGEVMAIYSIGKKGIVAFKRLMEYGASIMRFDSMWTTYDNDDEYTGTYYRNKFLMESTGIKLNYSDFGGSWNLLVTNRMAEMKKLHHQIFRFKDE